MPRQSDRPIVSIVVVVFNMAREAPRTLFTLTPEYQRVPAESYEVIVVDNGSVPPLGEDIVKSISKHFRYIHLEPGNPSPAAALNHGARQATGQLVGLMIDGARMLSPGILQYGIRASRAYQNPVVSTLGFHLGHRPQPVSVSEGYDQAVEDRLLDSVDWRRDGYELFRIASFAESSQYGWLAPIAESNCLFVRPNTFHALGGFDEAFDLPGGGFVNLDLYRRACESEGAELVMLLGEGTFHQFHNGAMTGQSTQEVADSMPELFSQYFAIRGEHYAPPLARCDYLGHAPPSAHPGFLASFEGLDRLRGDNREAVRAYEEQAMPPNRLGAAEQRAIIILGMHRSGTSMLAGSLQQAGLVLGEVFTRAAHNAKGNRESAVVVLMHEDLLNRNGATWRRPPERVLWGVFHKAVRDVFVSSFGDERTWGFKDPRTLLTLDGWLEALPHAEFVGIFRHPALVARSLQKRDNMPIDESLRLWHSYNVRLLDLHNQSPFPLIEFHDDSALLRDKLKRLVELLNLPLEHQELTFFEDGLRSKAGEDVLVAPKIDQLYNELRARAI